MTRNYIDDDSENDIDFNVDNSKLDANEDEEPSEEFEEDLHDADVKPKREFKKEPYAQEDEEDEDEDITRSHRTRSRKQINYNEELYLNELDEDETNDADDTKASRREEELANEDGYSVPSAHGGSANGRTRRTRRRRNNEETDGDFNIDENDNHNAKDDDDDFLASDDEFHVRKRRKRQPNFIVNDDYDDDGDDNEYDNKSVSRRTSRNSQTGPRGRRGRWKHLLDKASDNESDNGDAVTLEDEMKDLQKDSPLNSPKRNLRNRKDVNYTLPPPYLSEAQLEELENSGRNEYPNSSPRKGRGYGRYGGATSSTTAIRRLFPTVGPFGGGDVHSLFQSNNVPSSLAALANAESSDSDDENDLIKPTDPNDTNNNIISTSNDTSLPNHKKKNTLADTDPLGIDTNIDFSVIGGLDNYINQLKEMVTLPLLYPEVYSKFHITPPRGVLFHGPPGTGKTLMARALAASCSSQNKKITFFMRKGADCLSKWVGEAERHLRLLFEEAKQHQPSIIFFDEIDGLAPVRSSKQEQIHASIVSTLLALMDGMDNRGQVIIIGATNRPDSIDPALRRPGRFDREFYFPLPDLNAREEILKIHMRKWDNKLDNSFIKELAILTKGYGGADLRALCTESALNSIQRSYPQIYKVNDKLKIDISKIKTTSSDFTRALKKIIPSSARSTNSISEPLPNSIKPLLDEQFNQIITRLHEILPVEKEISLLEEAEYESFNNDFRLQQLIKNYDSMRVFRPRIAISGTKFQGLKYLSNALINKLEGFTIQVLDLGKIFSDSSVSVENLCIQLFSELKRHKPSILFIPDTIGFLHTVTESIKSTIKYLIRGINNNDKILLYCEVEGTLTADILDEIEDLFDISEDEIINVRDATNDERRVFFETFWKSVDITPNEYNDISIRPKKKQEKLEIVSTSNLGNDNQLDSKQTEKKKKELAKTDMRLKNSLKVKLSGLLDIFKARYKRFKKPMIDDSLLVHLFDEVPDANSNYQIQNDKILEISTGKLYNNIDLEVIEERLWNGFYNEPRHFLHDLELILKDANTSGERDRILKANEMYAHAVVGVEEIEVQFPALAIQWKEVSLREKQRKLEYLKLQKQAEESLKMQTENRNDIVQSEERIETEEEHKVLATAANPESILENSEVGSQLTNEREHALVEAAQEVETQTQTQAQLQPGQELIHPGDVQDSTELNIEPTELTEPAEKIEVENIVDQSNQIQECTDEHVENGGQSKNIKMDPEEEGELIFQKQMVTYDIEKMNSLKILLLAKTENFTLMRLEKVNSKLCDLVWKQRLSLDKSELLQQLETYISSL